MTEFRYYWRRLGSYVWRTPEPVTRSLIAINVATFLLRFLIGAVAQGADPFTWIAFDSVRFYVKPWSLVTYPLITDNIIALLLTGYMLWAFGGTVERSWTSRRYLQFLAGITLVTSASLAVGSLLLGLFSTVPTVVLSGLWMPLAAVMVSFCVMNPDQMVLMGFVLPIKGRYLMWGVVGLMYFVYAGFGGPWLAIFALAGVITAYVYTRGRDQWVYARQRRPRGRAGGPPNALQHTLDWLLYYWERLRRRGPRR